MAEKLIGGRLEFVCTSFWQAYRPLMMRLPKKSLRIFSAEVSKDKLFFFIWEFKLFLFNPDIEWPKDEEALSQDAVDVVEAMLTMDPNLRPGPAEYKQMTYFNSIDFDDIMAKEPPFIPNVDDPQDTGYFNAKNQIQHLKMSNYEENQQA